MVQTLCKNSSTVPKKLNIHLSQDPAISLVGTDPREMKAYVHGKPYTQMFITALLIVAPDWKQPNIK